ncbi:DUF421 domain-containing protein [Tepidibacillus infernus]|uniref:YetF C-terminal domain-containing protein n=1 Tax=Tepidibacillus decaturensis TaxID=1413211 RepID=A0A135L274_9BACI|nr:MULTISPECIES: DUF421 domain-containing protein [Tepidibacillus]KXG43108.1 hypothetical protein U473_03015 [Tepidibacillus decaturensis]GBF10045.1 hypothetical protein HK1_00057 [Tepidibacillus sp. HK-1]
MTIFTSLFRTLFMYFFVLVVLRLMGKREIGKLSIFDVVVYIMMADIAVLVIEDTNSSILKGILPILALMVTQVFLSYISLKSKRVRDLVEGEPSVLIANGKIRDKEMAKQRYSMDDLLIQLREKNINNVADVEFAILEPSGKLTVFPKPSQLPVTKEDLNISGQDYYGLPLAIIEDGKAIKTNLGKINKDINWLKKEIRKHGIKDISQVFFATVDHTGKLFIDLKDQKN